MIPFGWATGGTTNGATYGLGSRLAAIRDALFARTVCSNGNVSAAAPSADTLSTSRRDRLIEPMTASPKAPSAVGKDLSRHGGSVWSRS